MPITELEGRIRSRTQSTASDPRRAIPGPTRWKQPGSIEKVLLDPNEASSGAIADDAAALPGRIEEDEEAEGAEFVPKKKLAKHPAEQKKAVMMALGAMGSLEDQRREAAFKKSPRSMIRRFSRAASFKRASEWQIK